MLHQDLASRQRCVRCCEASPQSKVLCHLKFRYLLGNLNLACWSRLVLVDRVSHDHTSPTAMTLPQSVQSASWYSKEPNHHCDFCISRVCSVTIAHARAAPSTLSSSVMWMLAAKWFDSCHGSLDCFIHDDICCVNPALPASLKNVRTELLAENMTWISSASANGLFLQRLERCGM